MPEQQQTMSLHLPGQVFRPGTIKVAFICYFIYLLFLFLMVSFLCLRLAFFAFGLFTLIDLFL